MAHAADAKEVPPALAIDRALVERAIRGDRGAFGRLHARYARMVHAILLGRVPARETADLVHDVFLYALDHVAGLRDADAFGGWIAAIARNRATDFHRRSRPGGGAAVDPDELEGGGPSAVDRVEAGRVLAAIRTLPEAYRETLLMRLVEGMSGPEIAETTGLTPGSVRVNLHRGMALLRERLGGERPK